MSIKPLQALNNSLQNRVIVELRAEESYAPRNEHHIINYLRATGIKVGLIINFGKDGCKPRRFVA